MRLFESGMLQAKLRISQPGDADEQEADRAAEQIVSRKSYGTGPVLQRKCACGGTCSSCKSEDEQEQVIHRSAVGPLSGFSLSIQRAPAADPSSDRPAAEQGHRHDQAKHPGERPHALVVEDDAPSLAPGQMRKTQFVALLQSSTCATADAVLEAVGHTTKGCPYIKKWLAHYKDKDAAHLMRAMHKYAPETVKARSAHEAIALVNHRVQRAALSWAKTGKVSDLPEGIQEEMGGGGGFLGGLHGFVHSGFGKGLLGFLGGGREDSGAAGKATAGKVQRKASNGTGAGAHDAATVKEQLGSGHSLDGRVQSQMSSAFGYDFSSVRVHTDAKAGELSGQLQARAFTIGSDVAFAGGEYKPGTLVGDALIAHELAHVVQQGGGNQTGTAQSKDASLSDESSLEQDADRSAVGAVISAWTGAKKGLAEIGANALPRLKSGLKLQRCSNCGGRKDPAPTAQPEISCTAQSIGGNVAACMIRVNKQPYSCDTGIHYATNYQTECPGQWKDKYRLGYADPDYFEQLDTQAWDWRLKSGRSASAAIKKWLTGLTIAECLSTTIACEIDAVRAAIGDAKFDKLYGSEDEDVPESRRLRISTNTSVTPVGAVSKGTATSHAGPAGMGTIGNRPVEIGEWYYFKNHPKYRKKHPGGDWQGENSVYLGWDSSGHQKWIGLGSSTGPPLNQPEVTEDGMLDELLSSYNAVPWGPDIPELARIRAANGGTLPPEYQEQTPANPLGYPKTITKTELIDAGGGFLGHTGATVDPAKVGVVKDM